MVWFARLHFDALHELLDKLTMKKTDTEKQAQLERFREKSRELGCDDNESRFNDRLKKIARPGPQKKNGKGASISNTA